MKTAEHDVMHTLRSCAFCPNTCRPSYAATATPQIESQTPSAMSLLALAVLDGRLDPRDSGVALALARRDAVRASRGRCDFGFDIDTALDQALQAAPAVARP